MKGEFNCRLFINNMNCGITQNDKLLREACI